MADLRQPAGFPCDVSQVPDVLAHHFHGEVGCVSLTFVDGIALAMALHLKLLLQGLDEITLECSVLLLCLDLSILGL